MTPAGPSTVPSPVGADLDPTGRGSQAFVPGAVRDLAPTSRTSGSGRLLGYARVSASGLGVDVQLRGLWGAGCADVWLDSATGAGAPRPALDELRGLARCGDVLVVWRLDCLARTLADLLHTVRDLAAAGVGFRSVSDGVDTTAADAPMPIVEMFGALTSCESALASERAHLGLSSARVRGSQMGRPAKRPGVDVTKVAAMREQGSTMAEIAAAFGVSRATLYRALGARS